MRVRHAFRDVYATIRSRESWDHWDSLYVALEVWCDLNRAGMAR